MVDFKGSVTVYAEVKAAIKAEMENRGKKYPTNTNGLSEEFIIKTFAPKLKKEDIIKIASKRKEFKKATKKTDGGEEVQVGNWFPAFRSWVGKEYFPEFSAKKPKSEKKDEMEDFLEKLLKGMGEGL
jgi:hypothetical protein